MGDLMFIVFQVIKVGIHIIILSKMLLTGDTYTVFHSLENLFRAIIDL